MENLEDRRFYVYGYFDPRTGVIFYVGKGQGRRAWAHTGAWELKKRDPFHNKLRGMARKGVKPIVRILCGNLTDTEALELETLLITTLGRRDLGTGPLLNLTDGGEGTSGRVHRDETKAKIGAANAGNIHSDEARRKMSESGKGKPKSKSHRTNISAAKMGKPRSAATIEKMRVANLGKKLTAEHSAKIAAGNTGKKRTPEQCERISAAKKGKPFSDSHKASIAKMNRDTKARPIRGTNPATGETKVYQAMADVAADGFNPSGVSHCCRGRSKTSGGWQWEYIEQQTEQQ